MASNISRKEVFKVWRRNSKHERFDAVFAFIIDNLNYEEFSETAKKQIKSTLRSLCLKMKLKWDKSGRHRDRFLSANLVWLDENITFPDGVWHELPSSSTNVAPFRRPGRPSKSFEDSSEKIKKRKVKSLLESKSPEEISIANEINLRKMGKRDSAAIVRELSLASPSRGTRVKKVRKGLLNEPKSLSPDEALAMMIDANLSTHQYEIIRRKSNQLAENLFPSYDQIKQAKKRCYPLEIKVTETSAESDLQSLINHTIRRLCAAQKEVLSGMEELKSGVNEVTMLVKWGCDGAQQKQYKQKFTTRDESDENLFSLSMVPIQLYINTEEGRKIIWQNPAPSSPRYCRPIKFIFAKETTELITKEVNTIEQKINSLTAVDINDNDMHILVKPIFMLTMIDGKVCTALSTLSSSSQTCFLCGAKPKEMNNLAIISKKRVNEKALSFGLSPLHSWIRFMECILHIAYRLDIKVWQARGLENQSKVAVRKKSIQERFKNELGLLVDMPTQQAGNTNDGNTARRFFREVEKSADITGVNLELIKRFHIILETLGCGFAINEDAFEKYATDTRKLYLKEYPWYYMPTTIHKVLFHGKDVISSSILPIGQLSEEAQEARNKDIRRYREFFTRKTSRVNTNADLLNRLLISSDPFIASLRHVPKRKRGNITQEVFSLLSISQSEENTEQEVKCSESD